jgi:hypothetical protein
MLSYIANFFGIFIIAMIAHKIISFLFMIVIVVCIYVGYTNPKLVSDIVTKAKTSFASIKTVTEAIQKE